MASKVYESATPPPPGGARPAAPGPATTAPPPAAAPSASEAVAADDKPNPAVEAFHRIQRDVGELKEYAQYYVAAKVDGVKQTVRKIGTYAALGVIGLIAFGALVATAVGLVVVGLAQGLGRLFGDRYWLGDIVAGVVVLGAIGLGVWLLMKKLTGTWRSQTMKKYEERKQSQRTRFGHDVTDRAAEGAAADRGGRRKEGR